MKGSGDGSFEIMKNPGGSSGLENTEGHKDLADSGSMDGLEGVRTGGSRSTSDSPNCSPKATEESSFSENGRILLQRRFLTRFLSKKVPPVPLDEERKEFPAFSSTMVDFLFTWLFPVLKVGYKRTLEPNDLFRLNSDIRAATLAARFDKVFQRRLAQDKQRHISKKMENDANLDENTAMEDYVPASTLCLFSALETFRFQFMLACALMTLAMTSITCNPLLSRQLISIIELKAVGLDTSTGKGVGYALGMVGTILVGDILKNMGFFVSTFLGAELKGMFTKLMLEKSFRLSEKSRKKFPSAVITSIMSTDLARVDLGTGFSPWFIIFPIPAAIAIGILIHNIQAPALAGILIMFVYLLLVAGLGTLLFMFRVKAMKLTDTRVGYMKEILNNMKMIKFYSWEIPYFDLVLAVRKREMSFLFKMEINRSFIIAAASSLASVSSYTAFMVLYAVSSPSLRNPAIIFPSITLFGVLAGVIIMLPLSVANGTDAFIGLKRVGDFLAAEETQYDDQRETTDEKQDDMEKRNVAIETLNASFEWEQFDFEADEDETKDGDEKKGKKENKKKEKREKKERKKSNSDGAENKSQNNEDDQNEDDKSKSSPSKQTFTLNNLHFSIAKGEFVVITGLIGSGKSSLLHALNGKMKRKDGNVRMNGSVLMCGVPWIQNATVQENLTFGLPFDREWYQDVIRACALQSDLDILPAGDQTEIGERGITLSGGQKARMSLARAVYSRPDIILLDDVLSAVDSKVGKQIMDDCVLGLLKHTTRVLATHQLSLIGSASRIIFLSGSNMVVGTFEELQKSNAEFRELMQHSHTERTGNEDSESVAEEAEDEKRGETVDGRLVTEEQKSVNAIGLSVYRKYAAAGAEGYAGAWIIPAVLFCTVMAVFLVLFSNTWLSFWVEYKFDRSNGFYIAFYTVFTFAGVFALMLHFTGVVYILNRASRILNIKAARRILHVPMEYMDVTPMGRVINRFTKDTDTLDNEMCDRIAMVIYFFGFICGVLILCIVYLPWFAIAVPFLFLIFFCFGDFYQASSREIKRVDAIQRSHVYGNFNETLTGLDTIRDYHSEATFLEKNDHLIDRMNEAGFITVANQRWFEVVLSILCAAFALLISFLCVFRVFDISAASLGLLLSYVLQMSNAISSAVVMYTQVEQDMNSTERIMEYAFQIPQEAAYIRSETAPPAEWPQHGQISFKNASMRYRPGLPLVLRDFSAEIKPSEKIGICGRTGAGKSSIMVALYRLAELSSGSITIDGVDIRDLGLNNLRSKLSIIPQDPVLFRGTIRSNLDPFKTMSDDQLWDILRRSRIIELEDMDTVKNQKKGGFMHKFHLDQEVEDEGVNFSLGEKQLVAFARALVRGCKILILDEATSSVDYATDSKLQKAIVEEFSDCTILCIAHRLKTILDYDRIMVLDKGQLKEFDTPRKLYNSRGIFRQMCDKSLISELMFSKAV